MAELEDASDLRSDVHIYERAGSSPASRILIKEDEIPYQSKRHKLLLMRP